VDKVSWRGAQAVEPEEIHFFYGFFSRPFLRGDAISGDENAGAVLTEAAVHEDFLPRIIVEKREKLDDLFVGWGRPAVAGMWTKRMPSNSARLRSHSTFSGSRPQIDDGGNAQHFQLREAYFVGLRAAIQDSVKKVEWERKRAELLGMRFCPHPVNGWSPPTDEQVVQFLSLSTIILGKKSSCTAASVRTAPAFSSPLIASPLRNGLLKKP